MTPPIVSMSLEGLARAIDTVEACVLAAPPLCASKSRRSTENGTSREATRKRPGSPVSPGLKRYSAAAARGASSSAIISATASRASARRVKSVAIEIFNLAAASS